MQHKVVAEGRFFRERCPIFRFPPLKMVNPAILFAEAPGYLY
jgi:hypothetical protein